MSDWREIGDVPLSVYESEFRRLGSPMLPHAQAIHAAAKPHSGLALAMMFHEKKYDTWDDVIPQNYHNPLAVAKPGGGEGLGRWEKYDSYPQAVKDWRERVTSSAYKGGVYAQTRTLAELVHVYAPSEDNNDEANYVAVLKERLAAFGIPYDERPAPAGSIVFGRVPRPAVIEMIVEKPYDGAGFTRVTPRQIVGACTHITDGDPIWGDGVGDLEWYHDFFATGGERQYDALTDYGISRNGTIAMWNDPFGTRMPWANGGSDGLEGDGAVFTRLLGVGAINGRLYSKENVGKSPAKLTDAQLEANAQLDAWHFDQARVPWNEYPFNPHVGCVTDTEHWEFATKECPGPGVRSQTNARQNRTRAIMKQYQAGGLLPEVPRPDPVDVDHDKLPAGLDLDLVKKLFGTGKLHRPGKKVGGFGFNLGRAWSEAWLERGTKEKQYPAAVSWYQFQDSPEVTRDIISFANGWVLARLNARAGWQWL